MDEQSVANCVLTLMHAATSAHILHLQTRSYAQHMALGSLYEGLPGLVDDVIEAWQGKNGKIVYAYVGGYQPPKDTPLIFVENLSNYFQNIRSVFGPDSEIQNMLDEIQALFDSTIYKLKFLA